MLWCAVRAIMTAKPGVKVILYTDLPPMPPSGEKDDKMVLSSSSEDFSVEGEELEDQESFWSRHMRRRALDKFGVRLPSPLEVVELKSTGLLNPSLYPRLTLVLQSLMSVAVGGEALLKATPEYYVDTCGVPFVLPLARLLGCRTACYVHYPVISTNMLRRVRQRKEMYNNRSTGALTSFAKTAYYKVFALLYGCVGSFAQVCVTNSSWTRGHVRDIFWRRFWWQQEPTAPSPSTVFPPCNTEELTEIPLKSGARNLKKPIILSIGQFRPEKDHALQIEAFALALRQAEGSGSNLRAIAHSRLVLVGGCRTEEDARRVEGLRQMARDLGLSDQQCEFHVNVPYSKIKDLLSRAVVGIHTMVDEHFGIGVVEYMASGVIAVANNSGGPAADIIAPVHGQATGYLASTAEEYASALVNALCISDREREKMQVAARTSIQRFSEKSFDDGFVGAMDGIF